MYSELINKTQIKRFAMQNHQHHTDTQNKPTIVLVHGAFADGSTWNPVIQLLQAEGFNTIAVQNPLSSLDDDVLATQRVLNRIGSKSPIAISIASIASGSAVTTFSKIGTMFMTTAWKASTRF